MNLSPNLPSTHLSLEILEDYNTKSDQTCYVKLDNIKWFIFIKTFQFGFPHRNLYTSLFHSKHIILYYCHITESIINNGATPAVLKQKWFEQLNVAGWNLPYVRFLSSSGGVPFFRGTFLDLICKPTHPRYTY